MPLISRHTGQIPTDKQSLQALVSDMEKIIQNLEQELDGAIEDQLPLQLARNTAQFCRNIYHADIEEKIERQKLTLHQMDEAIDFLLEQGTVVVAIMIPHKHSG